MIIGYRLRREESFLRRFSSKVYSKTLALTLGIKVRDVNCPLKLFRRSLLDGAEIYSCGFLIDAELVLKAIPSGFRLKEIGVVSRARWDGRSTIRLRHMVEMLKELAGLRLRLVRGVRGNM